MDIVSYNREAWTHEVQEENIWTLPVSPEVIVAAKAGDYQMGLTPTRPVPHEWMGDVAGKKVLCLACGGGQQGPIFAALGADVTVFDNCPAQLSKDELVAQRETLHITLEQGDMRDLSRFADQSFDLIFHPVSNCFVDEIQSTWDECYRVLKPGCSLLSGLCNPLIYIFDVNEWDNNQNLVVKNRIPYSNLEQLPPEQLEQHLAKKETLEFGHSLESQIGGQIKAGFSICGFYEDNGCGDLLDAHIDTFIATRAIK